MGKVTDTAVTASRTAHSSAPKVPTSEQLRMAQLLVDPKSEDHSIRDKVHKVMELTRCDENSAFIALHDCDNDVELAVVNLLEGDQQQDDWVVQEGKKAKKQPHPPNAEDAPTNDEIDISGKPLSNRRQRGGGGNRGGGATGGSADGQTRFRGRNGGAGTTRGALNKENDSFGDFGGGERGGFSKGRGRGARDNGDRGGRGRGFGARGNRRGGGGFNQSDGGGVGGFAQIDSWNVPAPDNNTWDNSMASAVSNGPTGEWGKRKNGNESNTWDNSMANTNTNTNTDYDWGGEEDWSKLRDGMVIEPSAASKGSDKPPTSAAPSTGLAQAVSPAPAPAPVDGSRVRGESIDVNSLFGSNQPVTQQSASSATMWTTSKQATADLKNELGIGKMVPPVGESTSHTHNKDLIPPKLNAAKVEMPSTRAAASSGPIDVQFGDMTLGADTSHGLFDFSASTGYQQQSNSTPKEHQRSPQQHTVYQRAAAGDHVNGADLLSSSRATDAMPKDSSSYPGSGSFSSQPSDHSVQQGVQQKALQQQQQFASNRVSHPNANQAVSALPQRPVNSGTAVSSEHQRPQLLPSSTATGPASFQHQTAVNDSMGVQQFSRDENLVLTNMGTFSNASTVPALSKTQVSAGTTINQPMGPYQQAMAGIFPYMLDQASLNYLQSQSLLYNTGGYDIRTVNSLGGANMGMGRDTGDLKTHMMRQENGSLMPPGSNAPPAAGAGNLNMPPPGLPGPTVSNAEAAALAQLQLYPQFQSIVNYPPSGSPFLPQPQFYIPNVSSASGQTGGNQYQRSGGYQPAPQLFGNAGYEELQQMTQMTSQADYGKTNYAIPPPSSGKPANSGSGSGMAMGANDVGNKYGAGMKGPYDSKQFAPATATPPPQLANMNYTQAATAPAHYGYSGYMQPVMNMNMMPGPAMPSNAQMTNDMLNQRTINQNGKPPGGPSGVGKGMTQYQYGTPWGN